MRAERERAHLPQIALAGYTNAGKSTLLNRLTGAEVGVRDRLFHTLDPTTRELRIHGRPYLLTDTVGFIRKLPHQVVDAFAATLHETREADLILHVVDASAPEDEMAEMLRAVDEVLENVGAGDRPRLLVLNKADALDDDRRTELAFTHPDGMLVSAATGEGIEELGDRIEEEFRRTLRSVDLLLPYSDGARLAELHDVAGDLERTDTAGGRAHPRAPAGDAGRALRALLGQRHAGVTAGRIQRVPARLRRSRRARRSRVRRLDPAARLPVRAHDDDAGYDLHALHAARLEPGERAKVRTGIAIELPAGHAGLVLPRSRARRAPRHRARQRARPHRRGLPRRAAGPAAEHRPRAAPFEIAAGDRIAQLVIVAVAAPEVVEVDALAATQRGEGGFGSTGR